MKNLVRAVLSLALITLTACATPPAPAPKANIGFTGAPIKLDVTRVTVDNQYHPSGRAPNVEQLHTVTPSTVASRWAETRLVPVGASGQGVLTVFDARVVEEKLPVKGGVSGYFEDQVDTKLTGSLRAELVVMRPDRASGQNAVYKAQVNVGYTQTVLQSANLNERDAAYFGLLDNLGKEFDKAMTAEINRAMGAVVR
jgi:hypothetical protein